MVKIETSNRTMYFLVTLWIISLFAIGVYAVAPNPGHTAIEIEGVCLSDGTNCEGVTNPITLTGAAPIINFRESDQTLPAGLWRIAADGRDFIVDRNTFSAGNFVSYARAFRIDSLSRAFFSSEVTVGGDLIVEGQRIDRPITFTALCNDGAKYKSPNEQIHEEWCGASNPLISSTRCVVFLQYWDHNDNDPDDIYELGCRISGSRLYVRTRTESGDSERLGQGSKCGAICGISKTSL